MFPAIIKLLTPTLLKTIVKYVTEENELDREVIKIKKRLVKLEKVAHPKPKLVCKAKTKCKLVNE
tara:strand:- start:1747 stop:1941 length:195 start_codon:yes stop_codon:yes gene_type:complete